MTRKHQNPEEETLHPPADQAQREAAGVEKEGGDGALPEEGADDELQRLQNELGELQEKNAALADQYLRARAEMENIRRRAEEDVARAHKFGIESFAENLLPVSDSLDAALASGEATVAQLREGLQAIARQFTAALERNRVLPVNPAAGDRFDPNFHQAISVVPCDQEPNTVVGVLQKGYTIADRVLRPALVTVAGSAQQ